MGSPTVERCTQDASSCRSTFGCCVATLLGALAKLQCFSRQAYDSHKAAVSSQYVSNISRSFKQNLHVPGKSGPRTNARTSRQSEKSTQPHRGLGHAGPSYRAELAVTKQFQIFAIPCRCQKMHTDIPTDSPHTELYDLPNLLLFLREGYVLQASAVYFQPKGSTVGLASIKGLKRCSQLLSLTPKTSHSCLISVSSVQIREEEKITTPWVSCYGMCPADLL